MKDVPFDLFYLRYLPVPTQALDVLYERSLIRIGIHYIYHQK